MRLPTRADQKRDDDTLHDRGKGECDYDDRRSDQERGGAVGGHTGTQCWLSNGAVSVAVGDVVSIAYTQTSASPVVRYSTGVECNQGQCCYLDRYSRTFGSTFGLLFALNHTIWRTALCLVTLGETLHTWREEIARMWRFTRNNGITEGFHKKMETISRQAFGFRNFENYRLRVKVLCG